MAEFTFTCPLCGQGIQCDEQWCGQQIGCPSCQGNLIVPQLADPPPSKQPAARKKNAAQKSPFPTAKVVKYAIIGIVAGGILFYVLSHADSWQNTFTEKQKEAAKKSDGGELGHIATLYDVLDKTEPGRLGELGQNTRRRKSSRDSSPSNDSEDYKPKPVKQLPLLPAEWNLDVATASIPEGKANGLLSGTNFVVDSARVDKVGGAQLLSLRQGTNAVPDLELFVYLSLNPAEIITNRTWSISPDMKGRGVPQVIKRWKTNPKYAPTQKSYNNGYAMKLELGNPVNGGIPCKIFLSLPDPEKSVVAGLFNAETTLASRYDFGADPETMGKLNQMFDKRYGKQR